jgi:DNA-binding response OmpR family regulator
MRVLLLEDDVPLRRSYLRRLRADGHAVDAVGTLLATREALRDVDYDCLVLDRRVPDGDALDLVAELRDDPQHRPVLVVSAIGDAAERVRGLQSGVDDYVSKPVTLEELALRVRKLLVRRPPAFAPAPLQLGRVTLHRARREATLDGEVVTLTPTQYALLAHLAERAGEVVAADELVEACLDRVRVEHANPLPPHLSRLRRAFAGALELTAVRGRGYVLRVVEPGKPA